MHKAVFEHFGMVLLDLPYILCALVVFCSWRTYHLYQRIQKTTTLTQRRSVCLEEFGCLLLDVPAVLAYAVVYSTIWNKQLMSDKLKNKKGVDWHLEVFICIGMLLLDLPYLIYILLVSATLWRSWILWPQLYNATGANQDEILVKRRSASFEQFACLLFDIPCLVFFLYTLVTIWEFGPLMASIKKLTTKEKKGYLLHG